MDRKAAERLRHDVEHQIQVAVKRMEGRISAVEETWKGESRELLAAVAKNRTQVEDFLAKQGDYAQKLNSFADEFRMELASRGHRGNGSSPNRNRDGTAIMFAEDDLPAEYMWRLERLEKACGSYRYLDKNKSAQAVGDRLTALELAVGLNPDIHADALRGSDQQRSRPGTSALRVFTKGEPVVQSRAPSRWGEQQVRERLMFRSITVTAIV
jgi:hypothetical protein